MKKNRCRRVTIRFTEQEYGDLFDKYKQTTCRQISEYIRMGLLGKIITVKQRNQSLDELMGVLISMRNDLNAVGRNFNQVVRKLNSIQDESLNKTWAPLSVELQKELVEKTKQIQQRITQFSNQWLQK